MRLVIHFFSAVLLLFLTARKSTSQEYRLPKNIVPSHYSLQFTIDPESPGYPGYVEILITAVNASDGIIKLHAETEFITIESVLLDYKEPCDVSDINTDTDIVTLTCPKNYLDGEHRLLITFSGKFSTEDMDGFYKSTYEEDGKKYVLVSTQFEEVAARRAFPCFDEPSFKATFDVSISHSTNYTVLANTIIKDERPGDDGLTLTQFETTPKMSTYLVAFVVSKFEARGESPGKDYIFKVYSRPEATKFMTVPTTYGTTLIDLLSSWTGINYVDLGNRQAYQVAIPDFAAGAMENWGLITFREVDLLDEAEKTSHSAKQRIITVVAHELSHQWFGDYVTLDWWSDTWLNEGFATYFEFHIPSEITGEQLDTDKQFVTDVVQSVLRVDSLPSSVPLSVEQSKINTPREDSSKFDDISYDKGGSIVRMMRYILGEQSIKDGLREYLHSNHHSNTNPSQLLNSLNQVAGGLDFVKFMENWIYQAGYPLITVTLNEEGTSVNLTQERFLTVLNSSAAKTQWYVPISYTTSEQKNFTVDFKTWLEPNSVGKIDLSEDAWIILNIQEAGFYRVNYDETLWCRIIDALNDNEKRTEINVLNRAQLVDDIFNIARVGKIGYEHVFMLAEFLSLETEYYPWVSALNAISYINGKLGDPETQELLQNRTLHWINSAFSNISDTGVLHVDILKGVLIWDWACKLGQEDCINYAITTFEEYKNTNSLPDYNKRGVVFCYALSNSADPRADYEYLFNVFKNSPSSVEQNVIISSLGCISDQDVLLSYLSETIATNSSIRKQDASYVFRAVYSNNDVGVDVALTFLENNLQKITDTYKGMSALSNLINGIADRVKTEDQINRLKKIIEDNNDNETIKLVRQKALDTITANRDWTNTYEDAIKNALLATDPNNANVLKPRFLFSLILSLAVIYLFYD